MVSAKQGRSDIELDCPCCGARLSIDVSLGKVISHSRPPKHAEAPDLTQSSQFLDKEKARREAMFRKSSEDEKTKAQLLEKKFEEALRRSRNEPVVRPSREIDLD